VDNINVDLREIGWSGTDCIDLAQDRDQWRALLVTVINFQDPYNFVEFLSSCTIGGIVGFSRRAQLYEVCYYILVNAYVLLSHLSLVRVPMR
jgi:hypothetical protein